MYYVYACRGSLTSTSYHRKTVSCALLCQNQPSWKKRYLKTNLFLPWNSVLGTRPRIQISSDCILHTPNKSLNTSEMKSKSSIHRLTWVVETPGEGIGRLVFGGLVEIKQLGFVCSVLHLGNQLGVQLIMGLRGNNLGILAFRGCVCLVIRGEGRGLRSIHVGVFAGSSGTGFQSARVG